MLLRSVNVRAPPLWPGRTSGLAPPSPARGGGELCCAVGRHRTLIHPPPLQFREGGAGVLRGGRSVGLMLRGCRNQSCGVCEFSVAPTPA